MATYRISRHDPDEETDWTPVAEGLSLFALRGPYRELPGRGYSEVSILVEREFLATTEATVL